MKRRHYLQNEIKLIEDIISKSPDTYWNFIKDQIEDENFYIIQWLGRKYTFDNFKGLSIFPFPLIERWIDEDKNRVELILSGIPNDLDEYPSSIAAKIIEKFGTTKNVRNKMFQITDIHFWMGNRSETFTMQIGRYNNLKEGIDEKSNLYKWLQELVDYLRDRLASEISFEERFDR
jgi:hypothetical protein